MSDNVKDLTLEHLRDLRGRLAGLGSEVESLSRQATFARDRDGLQERRLDAIENDLAELKVRLMRIETRLNLTD